MKNLFQLQARLDQDWKDKTILLFLDYDGTLTPIAQTPSDAVLPPENKRLLHDLARYPRCQVVVISGRAMVDLKQMVDVQGITYIANHGWEMEDPSMDLKSQLPADTVSAMEHIKNELILKLSGVKGVLIEDKGGTLSVHYRQVSLNQVPLVKKIIDHTCDPFLQINSVKILLGKKVLEIIPPIMWNKGEAALWLFKKQEIIKGRGQILPVYIGDDTTDEDAFEALKNKGITVFVGAPKFSVAEYCLAGPQEATLILKHMAGRTYEKL